MSVGAGDALSRVVAMTNGKGGVGKTSLTSNIAGQLALAGYRVLAVDLDLSGNLGLDLGYLTDERADEGLGTFNAVNMGSEFTIIQDVRPGLDVIPGGRRLEAVAALGTIPRDEPGGIPGEFARRLAPVAAGYDLTLIDTAPGNPTLQDMALAAARYVVVPLRTDRAGMEGLLLVGPRVRKARESYNPALSYLGAVMFGHNGRASQVERIAREHLARVGDRVPLMTTSVRHSEAVAQDARERGQLAHELAELVDEAQSERLRLLASGDPTVEAPRLISPVSGSVAADYAALAEEILHRIAAAENGQAIA